MIWGERDPYIPWRTARQLVAAIPRAELVRLPGADHYVMEERPDEVSAALLDLLSAPVAARA